MRPAVSLHAAGLDFSRRLPRRDFWARENTIKRRTEPYLDGPQLDGEYRAFFVLVRTTVENLGLHIDGGDRSKDSGFQAQNRSTDLTIPRPPERTTQFMEQYPVVCGICDFSSQPREGVLTVRRAKPVGPSQSCVFWVHIGVKTGPSTEHALASLHKGKTIDFRI